MLRTETVFHISCDEPGCTAKVIRSERPLFINGWYSDRVFIRAGNRWGDHVTCPNHTKKKQR